MSNAPEQRRRETIPNLNRRFSKDTVSLMFKAIRSRKNSKATSPFSSPNSSPNVKNGYFVPVEPFTQREPAPSLEPLRLGSTDRSFGGFASPLENAGVPVSGPQIFYDGRETYNGGMEMVNNSRDAYSNGREALSSAVQNGREAFQNSFQPTDLYRSESPGQLPSPPNLIPRKSAPAVQQQHALQSPPPRQIMRQMSYDPPRPTNDHYPAYPSSPDSPSYHNAPAPPRPPFADPSHKRRSRQLSLERPPRFESIQQLDRPSTSSSLSPQNYSYPFHQEQQQPSHGLKAPPTDKAQKRRSRQLSLESLPRPDSNVRGIEGLPPAPSTSRELSVNTDLFDSAYKTAFAKREVKKMEGNIDKIVDKTATAFTKVNEFFAQNAGALNIVSVNLADNNQDFAQVDAAMSSFSKTLNVTMQALDAVAGLHPAAGVAVQAFKLVMELDATRRANNKKVGIVKLAMQDTMGVLFQLRHMKDPQEKGPDGQTIEGRIQGLMEKIAKDIKDAGNGCDAYLAKGLVAKTMKAKKYEARLTGFVGTFAKHKESLEFTLTVRTAVGVDNANAKLDNQTSQLKSLEEKMEMLFRKMDTPRERDLSSFIEEKGGAKRCVENNTLLEALVQKSGETMASLAGGRGSSSKEDELASARKFLQKELSESVDEAFKKNMALFDGKLQLTEKRLTSHITNETDRVIRALQDGAHSRIMDQDLQDIWKDMGWKGSSVKARHFILALHDFFNDKLAKAQAAPPTPTSEGHPENEEKAEKTRQTDRWALSYINVAHVQPILESVDDDCTGWITIKEVNEFAKSRPRGWSLPYWLGYWAVGWHTSITRYRNKMYSLVLKMFDLLEHVIPPNKREVNEYLMNHSMCRLELLLRSTTPASASLASDTELKSMTKYYSTLEEERLEANLEPLMYLIESPATVSLITGPGRIERYLYPLLYVLLKRHFKILLLATEHVISEDELDACSASLLNVFNVMDDRLENLEVIFNQTDSDVRSRLSNYAFGMFKLSHGEIDRNPRENTFSTWQPHGAFAEEDEDAIVSPSQISFDILKYGVKDSVDFKAFNPFTAVPASRARHQINGTWTGHVYREIDGEYVSTQGLIQIAIVLTPGYQIEGGGETYSGIFSISGNAQSPGSRSLVLDVTFNLEYSDGFTTKCVGKYTPHNDTISGEWSIVDAQGETISSAASSDYGDDADADDITELYLTRRPSRLDFLSDESGRNSPASFAHHHRRVNSLGSGQLLYTPPMTPRSPQSRPQMFSFTRTAPWLQRFRPPKTEFDSNRARARWSFACTAVMYELKRSKWWWDFFKTRFAERRRIVDLTVKSKIWLRGFTVAPEDALTNAERAELALLRQILSPGDSRFYSVLADIEIQKLPWHTGFKCDACEREIIRSRHVCAHCINDSFSDQVDLCYTCRDSKVSVRGFSHDPSHVIIQSEQVLHDHTLARTIRDARAITDRVKEYFRALERQTLKSMAIDDSHRGTHEAFQKGPAESEMKCACCRKTITPPCWVCIACTPDAFICESCDAERHTALPDGPSPSHLLTHALARVRDTTVVAVQNISTEARLIGLESKLAKLESGMEERVAKLEKTVDDRLASVEDMLRQIALSLLKR